VEFGDKLAFGKLLRAAGGIPGLERIRFTSPHPAAFTDDVIDAMAETPTVMPQLHMPLQSGSDRILKAMRRSYRSEKFLGILDRVREKIPNAAITTDIIVGFPGETEEDFQETLRVVEASRFATAFTFQYSIRPGTPAATLPDQVPADVVQERFERLVALQDQMSWEENKKQVGPDVEVLIATNEGRKDKATERLSGRAKDGRLVHIGGVWPDGDPRPGDLVSIRVSDAKPFYLIADQTPDNPGSIRRTAAGDAHDRAQAESCGAPVPAAQAGTVSGGPVSLGLPTLRPGVS
jgi:tRNA-2-methylthio-N6-dimethylallyladenosine synthase